MYYSIKYNIWIIDFFLRFSLLLKLWYGNFLLQLYTTKFNSCALQTKI
jgi:hypothetical protein